MIVASHRRSGTHLLINAFFLSYGRLSRFRYTLIKTHGMADEIARGKARMEIAEAKRLTLLDAPPRQPLVYIVRDARDTLASSYRWWTESLESQCGGILEHFAGISASDYINGACTLASVPSPGPGCGVTQSHIDRGLLSDPAGFWVRHVEGFLDSGATLVRFEDLLEDPAPVMTQVARAFGRRPPRKARLPQTPVGYYPGQGRVGSHEGVFDSTALAVIREKTAPVMERLGYP